MIRRLFRYFFPKWQKHWVALQPHGSSGWSVQDHWFRNDKPWPSRGAYIIKATSLNDARAIAKQMCDLGNRLRDLFYPRLTDCAKRSRRNRRLRKIKRKQRWDESVRTS